jgi:uncharacterized membrane protein YgaE (UPF0421/DUF939 family)
METLFIVVGMLLSFLIGAYVAKPFQLWTGKVTQEQKKLTEEEIALDLEERKQAVKDKREALHKQIEINNMMKFTGKATDNEDN